MSVESSIVLRIRSEFYLHTSVCLSHLRYSSRNLSHPFKGEEKDSEEEVGITQPLPLTPCLPSLSPMFPQCGQKHGGHGYSQHGLSPLSYQIDLELAQKAVLHYMSSWDWVGIYFKMVGMDPNRYAALCLHLPTTTITLFSTP